MTSLVAEEDLSEEFSMFGIELDDEDVVLKLQELCTMHRLDAGNMRLSKRHQKTPKSVKKGNAPKIHSIDTLPMDVEAAEELYSAYGGNTPTSKRTISNKRQHTPENAPIKRFTGPNRSPAVPYSPSSFSPASTTPAKKYNSRTNRGDVVASLSDTDGTAWHGSGKEVTIETYAPEQNKVHNIEEFSHVALPTQEEVTIVGRICCDSNGKLNAKSVVLEGSIDMSSGKMIPVDLSQLKEFALFPGQMVAMTGHNSTGQKFVASKLLESVPLPLPEIKTSQENASRLSLLVAAGPFSTSDSLSYEPLSDLVEQIRIVRPDVCILNGNCTLPFEEIFQSKIEEIAQATENEEMCIDYEKFPASGFMPTTPHIFILPSEFKQFIKDIKGCCCINPGRLTKGLTGSTFAKVVVETNKLASNQPLVKNVTAQIVRV
ncbi:DPOA2-like protein [Mya arenaria]|uniref:DPOA2-like protein n=1 Tax=Mya arenaria TaxID=6604 RepID=A0ABY7FH27_MYAAR|nr:DPOA2-like protein [Mya arenaria]